MTLKEMHAQLLTQLYETAQESIQKCSGVDLEKRYDILRETANAFSFACEKLKEQ